MSCFGVEPITVTRVLSDGTATVDTHEVETPTHAQQPLIQLMVDELNEVAQSCKTGCMMHVRVPVLYHYHAFPCDDFCFDIARSLIARTSGNMHARVYMEETGTHKSYEGLFRCGGHAQTC